MFEYELEINIEKNLKLPVSSGVGRGGLKPPPKCVKGARVMGDGTLLANVTLLILSIMQFTQFICSHDHTVRCSQ